MSCWEGRKFTRGPPGGSSDPILCPPGLGSSGLGSGLGTQGGDREGRRQPPPQPPPCGRTDTFPRQFWRTGNPRPPPPAAGAHRLQGAAPEPDRGGGRGRQALQLPEAWAPLGLRGQHLGPGVQGSSNSVHPPLGAHTAPGLRGARRSVGNSEPPMGEGRHFARPPSSGPGLDPCAQLARGL